MSTVRPTPTVANQSHTVFHLLCGCCHEPLVQRTSDEAAQGNQHHEHSKEHQEVKGASDCKKTPGLASRASLTWEAVQIRSFPHRGCTLHHGMRIARLLDPDMHHDCYPHRTSGFQVNRDRLYENHGGANSSSHTPFEIRIAASAKLKDGLSTELPGWREKSAFHESSLCRRLICVWRLLTTLGLKDRTNDSQLFPLFNVYTVRLKVAACRNIYRDTPDHET